MRNKNNYITSKLIYSHIASEIAMQQVQNRYKIFAISNCSHDAGAFDLTRELAIRFADLGKRTLMINGDLYGREEISIDGAEQKKGFSDLIMEEFSIKDILTKNKFFYIGCGSEIGWNIERVLCSPKVSTLFSALYKEFDVIFCATPSLSAPVSGKVLCKLSDSVILVAAMGQTKKKQIESAKEQLGELGIPISGIIATEASKTAWEQYIGRFDGQLVK